jgi:Zn-dependent peptidase ImmA (M78 family)
MIRKSKYVIGNNNYYTQLQIKIYFVVPNNAIKFMGCDIERLEDPIYIEAHNKKKKKKENNGNLTYSNEQCRPTMIIFFQMIIYEVT